jgi:hypothetical protein
MRTRILVTTLLMLAGCGGTEPDEVGSGPNALKPQVNQSCDAGEVVSVMVCPKGKVDGCSTGQTKVHKCVAENGLACALEVAILCPAGQVDGCDIGVTTVHRCVTKGAAPDCSLMLAIQCPKGQIDGCDIGATKGHQCVSVAPCQQQLAIVCPAGQLDGCGTGQTQYHICVAAPQPPCTNCSQPSPGK